MTPEGKSRSLNLLWVIELDYPTRLHHGATLRYLQYSKEMQRRGHAVFFGVILDDRFKEESRSWLESLITERVITGYFELSYEPAPRQLSISAKTVYPPFVNRVLHQFQQPVTLSISDRIRDLRIDAIIQSSRRLLFFPSLRIFPFRPSLTSPTAPHSICFVS